jgi:acetyl esterase/lipase
LFLSGGDSAGSLLCPDTIVYSRVYKDVLPNNGYELPLPAGMIFSSPISGTLEDCPSVQENRHKDYNPLGLPYIENYINNASSKVQPKPWAFLKEGSDLSANIPKHILVFVGGHEIGRDDNIYIADAFKKAGADTTVIREEYPHNWFLLGPSVVDEPSVNEKADAAFANWVIQTTGAI